MLDQRIVWLKNLISNHPTTPDAITIINIETLLDTTVVDIDRQSVTKLIFDYNDGKSMRVTFEIYDRDVELELAAQDAANAKRRADNHEMPPSIAKHLGFLGD